MKIEEVIEDNLQKALAIKNGGGDIKNAEYFVQIAKWLQELIKLRSENTRLMKDLGHFL